MARVIVAFQNENTARRIKELLEGAGVAQCVLCPTAAAVRRTLVAQHIPGVVCGFKLPDGMAEDLWVDLPSGCGMVILGTPVQLELCPQEGPLLLAAPMKGRELAASVRMLLALGGDGAPEVAERREEELALIREAKELLMGRHGMTEDLAHRFLQKQSMDRGMKLVQTAQLVLGTGLELQAGAKPSAR